MISKKTIFKFAAIALPSAVAIASLVAVGEMLSRISAFNEKCKCDVLAGLSARELAEKLRAEKPVKYDTSGCARYVVQDGDDMPAIAIRFGVSGKRIRECNHLGPNDVLHAGQVILIPSEEQFDPGLRKVTHARCKAAQPSNSCESVTLKVKDVAFDGDELAVEFNARPDMEVVRHYITAEPVASGKLSFRYDTRYNYWKRTTAHLVYIAGDFPYLTNITLRVRKGLPLDSKRTTASVRQQAGEGKGEGKGETASVRQQAGDGSLACDCEYVFVRPLPKPSVKLVDNGRYLPPGGAKSIRIESVSVTNIDTAIYRVEPRNVVQLLAREEDKYSSTFDWYSRVRADSSGTIDLSGECETGMIRCVNAPGKKETNCFRIAMKDSGPERGIFLTRICNADIPINDDRYEGDYNPELFRLVCLSDLGLTVRYDGKSPGVWVVSLMTGKPVNCAKVEVYSSANILLAEGFTDDGGWCRPRRLKDGEPFVVVVRTANDMTFAAFGNAVKVDETYADGERRDYMATNDLNAFVWTERGIYRHDERIFVHAIVRNGSDVAPKSMPVTLHLLDPNGKTFEKKTMLTDAGGTVAYDGFRVPGERPSGAWSVQVRLPGKDGDLLGERGIKVEEFAPPQIRVAVEAAEGQHPSNFAFTVSAEHLFGGPAATLPSEAAVVFEDVPFAPKRWKGYSFGNEELGLRPSYRRLASKALDENGTCRYEAPLWADSGRPKAMVRATAEGTAIEDGGRPATSRKSVICHYYPLYVGSDLASWVPGQKGTPTKIHFVCVDTNGNLVARARELVGKVDRIDTIYTHRRIYDDEWTWECDRVRNTVVERIVVKIGADGKAEFDLPVTKSGDYVLTVEDEETRASFGKAFYLSDWGDDVVRAPMSNPTEITIRTDKAFYRVGERPRLMVKSPFAGYALMTVLRDGIVYGEVLNLTNATSEVLLRPVERSWAPNVDVSISVVQSVSSNKRRLATRAHGLTTVCVRPIENDLDVKIKTTVEKLRVTVDLDAPRATFAVVTLVDEGINLLTGEKVPNPVGYLFTPRTKCHPLYDLYGRVLPVVDGALKASGVKSGGGLGAEMLGRVSPEPTRRFEPLALWREKVAIKDGKASVTFDLPEFVGEVRVTAVAYSAVGTGAAAVHAKVAPKLVMQPDAPRFAAPGDEFEVSMPLRNRGERDESVHYEIQPFGFVGDVAIAKGRMTNVIVRLKAPVEPGEMAVRFKASGMGESHEKTIMIPVRSGTAWHSAVDMITLDPGKSRQFTVEGKSPRFGVHVGASPIAECAAALEWLADYPHGCLEQTVSRIFPLLTGEGILRSVGVRREGAPVTNQYIDAGVRRVESMIRENDFVMWPDCSYPPWDREVSLYAAHFLVAAYRQRISWKCAHEGMCISGKCAHEGDDSQLEHVLEFLRKWALDKNDSVSAYACHTLAIAGDPYKDRMLTLYDKREKLDSLSRARLARAFVAIHDYKRATALMSFANEPRSIKEAAFDVLALLDLNPEDPRIPRFVAYLNAKRDRQRCSWGTTEENAHALLAIGAFFQRHPVKEGKVKVDQKRVSDNCLEVTNAGPGTAFLTVNRLWLNDPKSERDESNGIFIGRRYLNDDGTPADLANLRRGQLLVVELTITGDVSRVYNDLVVEDLFAGAFEPVHYALGSAFRGNAPTGSSAFRGNAPTESSAFHGNAHIKEEDWVMRKDARDDRMLIFSKRFELEKGYEAKVFYPVRVVSAGDFIMPGPSVEGMYDPLLRSRRAPDRIVVRH